MWLSKVTKTIALGAVACIGSLPARAEAGPLLEWLFGRRPAPPAYPVGQPVPVGSGYNAGYGAGYNGNPYNANPNVNGGAAYGNGNPGYAANYGTYYGSQLPVIGPAGAGYSAPSPSGIAATTMPSTLSYVPNYRSNSYRAPVTYYRPILTTDPNTGAQVVAMAPCTSYEYMTQRQPTLGRSALYGSNTLPAVVPAPQALPTYTLPSGGIPLAATSPLAQAPYTSGYRGYSALQPQTGLVAPGGISSAPAGSYPTAPLGNSPYYGGSASGGCTGSYPSSSLQSVPGLTAPQAPQTTITPAPTWGQPTTPPSNATNPGYPSLPGGSGVYPPSSGSSPSSDPAADQRPSLPGGFPTGSNAQSEYLRPQMGSIAREPRNPQPEYSKMAPINRDERPAKLMAPIPVPKGFNTEPRWNPGLLKEDDLTALRPINDEIAQYAGQSKQIHWASFDEQRTSAKPSTGSANRLRPIESSADQAPSSNERYRYDSSGWKSKR